MPSEGSGLAGLAALVEVMKDPKAFEEKLAELAARQDKLQRYEAELQKREVELGKRLKELEARHATENRIAHEMDAEKARMVFEEERLRRLEDGLAERAAGFLEQRRLQEEADAALAEREAAVKQAEAAARKLSAQARKDAERAGSKQAVVDDALARLEAVAADVATMVGGQRDG
jgi:chromosome segregation ATPase